MDLFEEIDAYLRLQGAIDRGERLLDLEKELLEALAPFVKTEADRRAAYAFIGQRLRDAQSGSASENRVVD